MQDFPARDDTRLSTRDLRWYALTSTVISGPEGPADRSWLAIMVLYISAVIFLLPGVSLLVVIHFGVGDSGPLWLLSGLFIALAAWSLLLSHGMRRGRRWTLTASALLFALYVPSPLLPLGVAGLVGILSKGTRKHFRGHAVRRKYVKISPTFSLADE